MIRNFEESRPEWMDVAENVTPELERDLANLESLNRRFGAQKLVLDYLDPVLVRREPLRILDLGTGMWAAYMLTSGSQICLPPPSWRWFAPRLTLWPMSSASWVTVAPAPRWC